jgi:hypothetical protein
MGRNVQPLAFLLLLGEIHDINIQYILAFNVTRRPDKPFNKTLLFCPPYSSYFCASNFQERYLLLLGSNYHSLILPTWGSKYGCS